MFLFFEWWKFAGATIRDFFAIEWSETALSSFLIVFCAGALFVFLSILKFVLRRKRFFRMHPGFPVSEKKRRFVWYMRIIYGIPKVLFAGGIFFLLLALADPLLYSSSEETTRTIRARERIELIDVSPSMGETISQDETRLKAWVARDAHLRFLEMRMGENDVVCLWVFADNPYKLQDCIQDDRAYWLQVYIAPYVYSGTNPFPNTRDGVAQELRRGLIRSEGGTNLSQALTAIIDFVNERNALNRGATRRRSLLMVTDIELGGGDNPIIPLHELGRLGVTPYVLLIERQDRQYNAELKLRFISEVVRLGGRVYRIGEEASLQRAFENIDELERSEMVVRTIRTKNEVFQNPLSVALLLLIGTVCAELVVVFVFPRTP